MSKKIRKQPGSKKMPLIEDIVKSLAGLVIAILFILGLLDAMVVSYSFANPFILSAILLTLVIMVLSIPKWRNK